MAQQINLTEDIKQEFTLNLDNGKTVTIRIDYIVILQGFYIISYIYQEVEIFLNLRITLTPFGIFDQFKNILPFDLLCYSNDNIEPIFQNDFTSGRVLLTLISQEEKQFILQNV